MPGPWSITRTTASDGVRATCTRTGSPGGEYLSAFSTRFTSARWIWCASTRDGGRLVGKRDLDPAGVGAELVERPTTSSSSSTSVLLGLRGARLQARQVEQVADEVVEPVGGGEDRLAAARRGRRRRSSRSARASAPGRGRDRHQRRAQVVADRAQQRRLHRVGAPQRLGLERLALELLAVDRDARAATPAPAAAGAGRPRRAARPLEAGSSRPPAARDQRGTRRPRRAEHDPRRRRPASARAASAEMRSSSPLDRPVLEQRAGDLGEQRRLARPPARPRGQLADDDRDDDEHREREPVLRVGERERVHRLEEEPVEREHARDRDRRPRTRAPRAPRPAAPRTRTASRGSAPGRTGAAPRSRASRARRRARSRRRRSSDPASRVSERTARVSRREASPGS